MIAKRYNKRVEVWQVDDVPDGYGGNTVSETFLFKVWCNIKSVSNNSKYVSRATDLGITDPVNAIIINLRHRKDFSYNAINLFIKYRGVKYIIQTAPNNINFDDGEIELIATRQATYE